MVFQLGSPTTGGVTAAENAPQKSASQAIFIGVATGVLVWTVTRVLDRLFPKPK